MAPSPAFGDHLIELVQANNSKGAAHSAECLSRLCRERRRFSGPMIPEELRTALGDSYAIERELGGGGMSRVFLATDRALGRQVVVKMLPADAAGQVSIERFRREITVAAQLQHPHIVPLLNAGVAGDLPYFTMPFVRGESLRVRLEEHGELPVNEAVRMLREVASALAFAHDSGVVHRDIKPDNVLLSGGAAMVTDFGVAKAISQSTTAGGSGVTSLGVALGTPAYMAPEQASADPLVDHRADIYAWGILAYELLTGATPFTGRPAAAMLAAQVTEAPDSIARRRPSLPPALAALVMRCLEKRASDRPQHARDLVQALDDLGTTSGGLTPTRMSGYTRPMSRALLVAAGVAVVVAGVWHAARGRATSGATGAIAVLPFENSSGDSTLNYLAEGMSDEVRSQLTEIPGLIVKARVASQVLRDSKLDLRGIGEKLGVSTVVQGSIKPGAGQMRVTAEVVRAVDGTAIWSHTFVAPSNGFANIQDSITHAVAGALRVRLATDHRDSAGARGTVDAEAYNQFLKGEYFRRRFSNALAIEPLKEAVARDPKFARAWASLATAYAWWPNESAVQAVDSVRRLSDEAADRALGINSKLAQAYIAKGATAITRVRFADAEAALKSALQLEPNNTEALIGMSQVLINRGRFAEGFDLSRHAVSLEPMSVDLRINVQYDEILKGRFRDAVDESKVILDLDPSSGYGARSWAMFGFALVGEWKLSDEQRALAAREPDNSPSFMAMLGHLADGDVEAAVNSAERMVRAAEPQLSTVYFGCDPSFDLIKTHPRFVKLMKEVGISICPPLRPWPFKPRPR